MSPPPDEAVPNISSLMSFLALIFTNELPEPESGNFPDTYLRYIGSPSRYPHIISCLVSYMLAEVSIFALTSHLIRGKGCKKNQSKTMESGIEIKKYILNAPEVLREYQRLNG